MGQWAIKGNGSVGEGRNGIQGNWDGRARDALSRINLKYRLSRRNKLVSWA